MLYSAGILFLVLGLFSGIVLLLASIGIAGTATGYILWTLYLVFSVVGYLLAASAGRNESLPALSRAAGAAHMVLGLAAAIALVLHGASIFVAHDGTLSLWYLLAIGFVLGAGGLAAHRQPAT